MQRPSGNNRNLGDWYLNSGTTKHAETTRDQTNNELPSPNSPEASTTSLSHSGSSIPYPFESQSFLRNENAGQAKGMSLVGRIIDKLNLSQSYLPGHVKGEVDQIIHSLNQYCSGYGKVAAIENLDPQFLMFRKFGWLRNYALLHLQDELAALEDELADFDKWNFRDGDPRLLVSRRLDYGRPDSRRPEIMASVHSKLKEYDEALLRAQKIEAIKRPSERSQRNVYNLIHNTESLVCSESDWIREGTDLAALGCAADRGWLNTLLADTFSTISRTATSKLFRTQEQKIKTGDEALYLVSLERLDNVLRTIVTISAAVLLLVPVYVLLKLKSTEMSQIEGNSNYQILTIFISTMIFSVSCSIFTQAKKQEVFTATAAYSAVLVVFLGGNISNVKVATNN